MLNFTPKNLIYISISLGVIVLLTTLGIILFPKSFNSFDQFFAFKGKERKRKTGVALFINNAITPLSVSIFYLLIGAILLIMKIHFKDFSFPSGHTTAGFIFFLSIAIAISWMIGLEYRETAFTLALIF